MTDVLVIGGGMGAVIAALSARRAGKSVVVVRRAFGATSMSSGAVDVAAPIVQADGSLDDDLARCAAAAARASDVHPFHALRSSLNRLPEALRFAADATGLLSAPSDKLHFLPTAHGTFKATAMAQRSQISGTLATLPSVVGVVDFVGTAIIDAAFVAKGLEADAKSLGRNIRFIPVPSRFFNGLEDAQRQPVELARRFDEGANGLAEELEKVDAAAFMFPPVIGLRQTEIVSKVGAAFRRPCAELLAEAHGSVPGLRLQRALDEALARSGVRVIEAEARVEGSELFVGAERLNARAVVLATGKFIGGGVRRDGRLSETAFGAPVFVSDRRGPEAVIGELLGERYGDDQPVFRAGVRIDEQSRVVGVGREHVFGAGSVIAGFDPAADGGGLGVAIFTGYLAGERAAAV